MYIQHFKQYLPDNPVIVEAGANDGEDTINMIGLWPAAKIYAFEPYPKAYQRLISKTASHPNISTYPIALGDKTGFVDFYVSRHPDYFTEEEDPGAASSILPPSTTIWHEPRTLFKETIQVPIANLDTFAEEHKIKKVDFMWLDMQGSEGLMLQACPNILSTVRLIQTEYAEQQFYEGTLVLRDLTNFLEKNGFKLIAKIGGRCGDAFYLRY